MHRTRSPAFSEVIVLEVYRNRFIFIANTPSRPPWAQVPNNCMTEFPTLQLGELGNWIKW